MKGIPNFNNRYYSDPELSEQDKQRAAFGGISVNTGNTGKRPVIVKRARAGFKAKMDSFESEYQAFIAKLKMQKENTIEEVTNVAETKVEEPQVTEEAPVVETKPKKTRTKKQVVEVLPEETVETTTETTEPVVEPDPFAEF